MLFADFVSPIRAFLLFSVVKLGEGSDLVESWGFFPALFPDVLGVEETGEVCCELFELLLPRLRDLGFFMA